jgi:hypothetical protein
MDQPKKWWQVEPYWQVVALNVVLLVPATWFWLSVVMRLALQTDYFFDVVFEQLGASFWGNVLLVAMVIGMPGLAVGVNGLVYIRKKIKPAWWLMALAVLFLAGGFLAIVKRG